MARPRAWAGGQSGDRGCSLSWVWWQPPTTSPGDDAEGQTSLCVSRTAQQAEGKGPAHRDTASSAAPGSRGAGRYGLLGPSGAGQVLHLTQVPATSTGDLVGQAWCHHRVPRRHPAGKRSETQPASAAGAGRWPHGARDDGRESRGYSREERVPWGQGPQSPLREKDTIHLGGVAIGPGWTSVPRTHVPLNPT